MKVITPLPPRSEKTFRPPLLSPTPKIWLETSQVKKKRTENSLHTDDSGTIPAPPLHLQRTPPLRPPSGVPDPTARLPSCARPPPAGALNRPCIRISPYTVVDIPLRHRHASVSISGERVHGRLWSGRNCGRWRGGIGSWRLSKPCCGCAGRRCNHGGARRDEQDVVCTLVEDASRAATAAEKRRTTRQSGQQQDGGHRRVVRLQHPECGALDLLTGIVVGEWQRRPAEPSVFILTKRRRPRRRPPRAAANTSGTEAMVYPTRGGVAWPRPPHTQIHWITVARPRPPRKEAAPRTPTAEAYRPFRPTTRALRNSPLGIRNCMDEALSLQYFGPKSLFF